jgi:hypothetical protein
MATPRKWVEEEFQKDSCAHVTAVLITRCFMDQTGEHRTALTLEYAVLGNPNADVRWQDFLQSGEGIKAIVPAANVCDRPSMPVMVLR